MARKPRQSDARPARAQGRAVTGRRNAGTSPRASKPPSRAKEDRLNGAASFPIVAIGASAGGLEAYKELFHELPADSGMAFVVIQHLDPSHHSMLTEIISKTTKMPVEEVRAGVAIRPDSVYVIPPNALMTIAGGRFQLSPREKGLFQHLSINHFMRSLAQEQKAKAIAIVLSGTGADGTSGMEDIKAEGGITFAQDPNTSKYDGMPRSAIDSGCADFILAPREIARELRRIGNHPYVRLEIPMDPVAEPSDGGKLPEQLIERSETQQGREGMRRKLAESDGSAPASREFSTILAELRKSSGVDFGQYKPNTIHRRALRRMVLLRLDSLLEYAQYLREHPEESEKLYEDVLIPVTSFFRDLEVFETLKNHVYPAMVKDKSNKGSIRMWAPGCSTGEETYSLAMTLLEFLGDRAPSFQVQIFGTDLNEKGIQKARAGIYREGIADEISPERMRRFFVKVDEGYRVNKAVRDMCVFARQDLANDPPFSQMNLVACRNLLIYIQPVLQRKIIPILHYALRSAGFLVLGGSESVSAFPELFGVIDKKNKIYAKKQVGSRLHYDFAQSYYARQFTPETTRRTLKAASPARDEVEMQAEADRVVLKHHAPVGVVINDEMEVAQFRGRTTPYLEPAPGKPSLNLLKLARNGLAVELRALVAAAAKKEGPARKDGIQFDGNGHIRTLNVSVTPLGEKGQEAGRSQREYFLILFEDVTRSAPPYETASPRKTKGGQTGTQETKVLKLKLVHAEDALRASIESEDSLKEEFQSANEEILSANEELQSTNEELETSKEELQSANEELNTVNAELRNKNTELQDVTNDISNLLNSTRIPVIMLDRRLCIRRITPATTRLLKVRPSDIGRPFADIKLNIDASDLTSHDLEETIVKVLDSLQPVEREVRDLEGHWHGLSIQPYRTQDNKIDGVVLALQDIDTAKTAGEQLKNSVDFLEGVVNTVREPLLTLNAELRVVSANKTFFDTFKVSPEETLHRPLYDLGNGQWNIPALRTLLEQVPPKEQAMVNFEVEHDFEGIGQRKMLLNARRLVQANPLQLLILLIITDITERTRAESESRALQQLLEQQRRIYFTTLSSISDFAYTFDREGRFLYVNKPLLDLWGLTLEEAVGKNFHDLRYEEGLASKLQRQIQQVFDTRKSLYDETAYTSPKGESGYYEYIFNPVFDADGTVGLVVGSTHDLTARKQTEAALIKSEKLAASGRLAAALAHEINNPLQAVTNLMELLRQSPTLSEAERSYANMVVEELGRVTHLTRQSLSFYRESTSPVAIDLNEAVEGLLSLYAKPLAAKKITVTPRYELGSAKIESYPGAIRQVLSILLVNATEAVADGGTIALRVRKSGKGPRVRGVRITMADNGGGISPLNRARLFEPFFTTKGERGTGLGLWVARGIIDGLRGTIAVRSSVRHGKSGTSFSIFLPNRISNVS